MAVLASIALLGVIGVAYLTASPAIQYAAWPSSPELGADNGITALPPPTGPAVENPSSPLAIAGGAAVAGSIESSRAPARNRPARRAPSSPAPDTGSSSQPTPAAPTPPATSSGDTGVAAKSKGPKPGKSSKGAKSSKGGKSTKSGGKSRSHGKGSA
jgi:hypothetical protein